MNTKVLLLVKRNTTALPMDRWMDLKLTAMAMSDDRADFQRHTSVLILKPKMIPFWLKHKHWDAICPTQPYPIAAWELVLDSVFNKYA